MLSDSGAEIGGHRRKSASVMSNSVAGAPQSPRKREIALRQALSRAAVHHQPYPSVVVYRRFPVFTAVSSPRPQGGENALARGIRAANVRLRGSH